MRNMSKFIQWYLDRAPYVWSHICYLPWQAADWLTLNDFAKYHQLIRRYSMCSYPRLRALYTAVKTTMHLGIVGDIVECGTARGGSSALMALTLKKYGHERKMWLFDTFGGLPPAGVHDPPEAKEWTGRCKGDLEEIQALLSRLGVLDRCKFVKGIFQNTLPTTTVQKIAVLHIDADWYESVYACLENLYDKVSLGGIIQIDDYGHWSGARKAVDEFMRLRNLKFPLKYIDYTGRQFVKE